MTLTAGTRLGPYEVTAQIGVGGMGEVYRATDTNLKRAVALKVLPASVASDAERLTRFQREAEVLASLNHPNIAAIYGLERSDGITALVMELVEGEDLAQRLLRGAIPLDEALPIAKQIAEALGAAHEQGIIHRDLKPANIKITARGAPPPRAEDRRLERRLSAADVANGTVKVLDFGLAKAMETGPAAADLTNSPTVSMMATQAGMILGTAAYMSPEQARGKAVTKATDIWAFGCVLYEMLTGKQAFHGEDVTEILATVVKSEPDWSRLPAGTPTAIRTLLRRCLRKERHQRFQDATDVRIEIEEALSGNAPDQTAASSSSSWRSFAWGAVAMLLLSSLAFGAVALLRRPQPALPLQATLLPPKGHEFLRFDLGFHFAISPDGTQMAFAANDPASRNSMLWVRSLDSTAAQPLAGTEGASVPFWSPDSRSIAFFARSNLKKIDAAGGPVITLAPLGVVNPQGGAWRLDGNIVFTRGTIGEGLYQVSSNGGPVTGVTRYERGEINHRWPVLLPDGRHLLFQVLLTDPTGGRVNEIRVLDLETKGQRVLLRADSHAQYANGYVFYVQQENLMAQAFDGDSLTMTGAPVALAEQVRSFSAGPSGLLAFQGGAATTELVWYTRDGKETGQVGGPGLYNSISLSPDGSKAATSAVDPQTGKRDIWVFDVARGTAARVTVGGMGASYPIWERDGNRVAYWDGEGGGGIYAKAVSGLGASQLVKKEVAPVGLSDISRDGKLLAYMTTPGSANARLWVHELAPEKSDAKDLPLLGTNFQETTAQFSPDGGWLAYASTETGIREIYAVSFPSLSTKVRISTSGGSQPRWRGDGKELFYIGADQNMTAVGLDVSGGSMRPGTPTVLFQIKVPNIASTDYAYDVTADGQRFLISSLPPEQGSEPITIYANWAEALKQ